MGNKLYLECFTGISGDMAAAALLDLGADEKALREALDSLPLDGFCVEIKRVKKAGLDVCDFCVILEQENHDHDMEYLYGGHFHEAEHHSHGEDDSHMHEHSHEHMHDHSYKNEHGHEHIHSHEHRGLPEIAGIIQRSNMTARAKDLAVRIFQIIAQAEAQVHGTTPELVHFHEVGAVDSIVDIVAAAVCLDNLDITEVIVPELYEGRGSIRCQHGIIPVPVPAVTQIVQEHGLILHLTDTEGELVTPTGAAIAAAITTSQVMPKQFRIKKIGIGAGKRSYPRPSLLRAMLIEDNEEEQNLIYKLETNIDDCNGEALGFVSERLFEAGARDVYFVPVYMKKNRPAYELNVVCQKEDIQALEQIIFKETTTIGIRRTAMERTVLPRKIKKVQTSLGEAMVKYCQFSSGERCYPEYESVISLCRKHGMGYQEVYHRIFQECQEDGAE